jgi:segregation and condensation protein B
MFNFEFLIMNCGNDMTPDEKIDIEQPEEIEAEAINEEPQEPESIPTDTEEGRPGHLSGEASAKTDAHQTETDPGDEDDDEPDDELPEEIDEIEATLETVVESVLFAGDEPLSPKRLVDIAEAGSVKRIRQCIKTLNKKYRAGGFSFRIEKISGGYQMMTLPAFNPWISKLIKVRADNKLTPAGLETLAIVAYKQPIIRADVEAIRGVASGEILRNLMYKGLVKIVGRAEILGRPMLYGTTKKFLDVFGLNTLKDLPKIEELNAPQ